MRRIRGAVSLWSGRSAEPAPDPGAMLRRLILGLGVAVVGIAVFLLLGPMQRWLREDRGCGWTAQGEVVLDRDLVDCPRHGIRMAPFSVLDCAVHEIRGRGDGSGGYGVRMDQVEQAEVRNCRISGFARGVRIRGGRDNRVLENEIEGNGYVIEVAGAVPNGVTEGHHLARNRILHSQRDGIHLGGGTAHTSVVDNQIVGSGEEGIAIERCEGCSVTGNTIEGSTSAAIDLKDSSGGHYESNVVRGSLVKVRGGSARNVFEENELVDSGYVFAVTKVDGAVHGIPSRNQVLGGSVRDSKVCFRFDGASANTVEDVLVSGCRVQEKRTVGTAVPSENVVSVTR